MAHDTSATGFYHKRVTGDVGPVLVAYLSGWARSVAELSGVHSCLLRITTVRNS
jgi:hypothetical protein